MAPNEISNSSVWYQTQNLVVVFIFALHCNRFHHKLIECRFDFTLAGRWDNVALKDTFSNPWIKYIIIQQALNRPDTNMSRAIVCVLHEWTK